MNPVGFVLPAASIGLGSLLVKPQRGFFPTGSKAPLVAIPQATIEERHNDELEITEHPIEQGAAVADHAYKKPAEVVIKCGWSNSPSKSGGLISQAVGIGTLLAGPLAGALSSLPATAEAAQSILSGNSPSQIKEIYQKLLQIQESRVPFDIFTGKRSYKNMLFRSIAVDTDVATENILMVTIVCRQVLIAVIQTVQIGGEQAAPEETGPVQPQGIKQLGTAPNFSLDTGSLTGALSSVQDGLSGVQTTLSDITSSVMSNLSGPISQVGDVISSAQSSLGNVLSQLPAPFDIPFAQGIAQDLSLSLNSLDLSGAIGDAVEGLPSVLEGARTAITATQFQIPAIASQLTSAITDVLPGQLSAVQGQIQGALGQLSRVLTP